MKMKLLILMLIVISTSVFSQNSVDRINSLVDEINQDIENEILYSRSIDYGYEVIPGIGYTSTETDIFYAFVEIEEENDIYYEPVIYKIENAYNYSRYNSHECIYYNQEGLPIYIDADIISNESPGSSPICREQYYFFNNTPQKIIINDLEFTDFTDSQLNMAKNYYQHAASLFESVQKFPISIPPIHYTCPEERY